MEKVWNKKHISVFLASLMCLFFLMMPHFAFADEVSVNGKMTIALQETAQEVVEAPAEVAETTQDATQAQLAQTGDALGFLIAGVAVLLLGGSYVAIKSRGLKTATEGAGACVNPLKTKHQIICVAVTSALVASTMFGMFLTKRPAMAEDAQTQADVTCLSNVVVDENGKVVSNDIVFKNGSADDVALKSITAPDSLENWQANFESRECVAGAEIKGNWVAESVSEDVLKQLKEAEANSEGVKTITLVFNVTYANKVAFAVYSKDDNSLNFYKRETVPDEGTEFNGLKATYVYKNFENLDFYYSDEEPEWNYFWTKGGTEKNEINHEVLSVKVVDYNIRPISTGCWFQDFRSCASFDLGKLDCSKNQDFDSMFANCLSLKQIDVSNFDTSRALSIGDMFNGCSSLESINVSNFNTSNTVNMGGMFFECKSLRSIDVSNFNTSKVTDMCGMFRGCEKLEELNLSNFDTSNVTDMYAMFQGCKSLKTLDLSNFDTSNVTKFSSSRANLRIGMFSGCESLTSLDLSSFDTSKITDLGYMFSGCKSLKTLDLSSFDTSKVIYMCYMFDDCEALSSLDLSSFKTDEVVDMQDMFSGCSNVKSLNLSNFNTSKVTGMNSMFYDCSNLNVDLSDWDVSLVTNHNSFNYNAPGVVEPNWVS